MRKILPYCLAILAFTTQLASPASASNLCNQKTIEFPWWLAFLIALGDAVVLWLFWPRSRKNKRKH